MRRASEPASPDEGSSRDYAAALARLRAAEETASRFGRDPSWPDDQPEIVGKA